MNIPKIFLSNKMQCLELMATYNSCKQLVVPRWDVLAFRKNRDVF